MFYSFMRLGPIEVVSPLAKLRVGRLVNVLHLAYTLKSLGNVLISAMLRCRKETSEVSIDGQNGFIYYRCPA